MSHNHGLVHMPLPIADINQAMKETSSTNEKLLQIIREIELCIFRNASAGFSSPPSPTPAPFQQEPTPTSPGNDDSEFTDGSSDGECYERDDPNWAWTISSDGINSSYAPSPSLQHDPTFPTTPTLSGTPNFH